MKHGCRRMKHIAALLQCMKHRWRGTKRSLYPSSPYGLRRDKQASCFFCLFKAKNGSGTWYCLPLSALQKCSGSPSGSNHPPGLVRFLLTQKMRKCFHFRKSSFTDPFFASNKIWAKKWLRHLDSNQGPSG